MSSDQTVIQKFKLDVHADVHAAPESLLAEIMDELKSEVLPQLENRLGGKSDSETVICLDRLELDVNLEEGSDWKTMLIEKVVDLIEDLSQTEEWKKKAKPLVTGLEAAWQRLLQNPALLNWKAENGIRDFSRLKAEFWALFEGRAGSFPNEIELNLTGLGEEEGSRALLNQLAAQAGDAKPLRATLGGAEVHPPQNQPTHFTRLSRIQEMWLYFLKNGRLPWWKASLGIQNTKELLAASLEFPEIQLWEGPELFHLLSGEQSAANRFIRQVPAGYLKLVLGRLLSIPEGMEEIWNLAFRKPMPDETLLLPLIRTLRDLRSQAPNADDWLRIIAQNLRSEAEFTAWRSPEFIPENLLGDWQDQWRQARQDSQDTFSKNEALAAKRPLSPEDIQQFYPESEAKEEHYPVNAGLVLLHPFLPALFERLGLTNSEGNWQGKGQETALYLLHYLATGAWGAGEDELEIPKCLCAWPEGEILRLAEVPEMPENLAAEQAEILKIVQENWKPMRGCTWESLAVDFLQRPGKLSATQAGHLKLQPEPHTLDVLLRFLGWGISPVRLPWMKNMIMIEWG